MDKRLVMISPVFRVLSSLTPGLAVSEVYAQPVAKAEALLAIDSIVSPYAMQGTAAQKRTEIIDRIVNAAVQELERTCRQRNEALLASDHRQICGSLNQCPDTEIRILRKTQSMSLNAFLESTLPFTDVRFGFTVSWEWGDNGGTVSTCYAPSIHPVMVDLRQSLMTDPYFVNRVSSM